ncbi:MAG: hypothetical protein KatS3mg077_1642 [Candidatus Binatia bacterium]|nr:MAG: hypothetical protein KatS3mg077_1642 [Candidatus Binatia bacterium]
MALSSNALGCWLRWARWGVVCAFSLAPSVRGHAVAPVVDASVVPLYGGEEVTVEAVVQAARREGNVIRLQLAQSPVQVEAVLVEGLLSRFPFDAERELPGKTVRASGLVREFRGRWEVVVRDPQNLLVIGKGELPLGTSGPRSQVQASPGIAPHASAPGSMEAGRLENIESRLQRLEARLEALERRNLSSAPGPASERATEDERLRKVEFRLRQLEQKLERRP